MCSPRFLRMKLKMFFTEKGEAVTKKTSKDMTNLWLSTKMIRSTDLRHNDSQ